MYRPEGWENPWCDNCVGKNERICDSCAGCAGGIYEEGADYMLESLKKEGFYTGITDGYTIIPYGSTNSPMRYSLILEAVYKVEGNTTFIDCPPILPVTYPTTKGYLVFIPESEE